MSNKRKIILLSVISILIVTVLVLGITYSFMKQNIDTSSVTEVTLKSCAKITLTDSSSIDLSNTYPMSKNRALQTTPYSFTVTSTCENLVGFNLYLATLSSNTLAESNIHYIITNNGSKNILKEGILSEATNVTSTFTAEEKTQYNSGVNGTVSVIYQIYNDKVPLKGSKTYDLYLYVDSNVTSASTMNKTFNGGIAVKSYDRDQTFADSCSGKNFAECITSNYSEADGLYLHDADLANGANDGSYRFSGTNPDNYVCFGSSAATCPEDNLYRIIGVFDGQVKLIKANFATSDLLGTDGDYAVSNGYDSGYNRYTWNGKKAVNTWSTSELNTVNLNTNFINNMGEEWANKIATTEWKVGGAASSNILDQNVVKVYNSEITNPAESTTYLAKVGLMYLSEFGYASATDFWITNIDGSNYNWMYLGENEWTITRDADNSLLIYYLNQGAIIDINNANYSFPVRPTFCLIVETVLVDGTGTAGDPFRIS